MKECDNIHLMLQPSVHRKDVNSFKIIVKLTPVGRGQCLEFNRLRDESVILVLVFWNVVPKT